MSYAFNPIPAKPTFGSLKPKISQSDYINRKKGKNMFCIKPNYCSKVNQINNYANLNSFNLVYRLEKCNILPVNKTDLVIGQYTKSNLNNVCTVSKGAPPSKYCSSENPCDPCQNNTPIIFSTTEPFYWGQTIDPLGELFGKSQCGELNYTNYIVLPK